LLASITSSLLQHSDTPPQRERIGYKRDNKRKTETFGARNQSLADWLFTPMLLLNLDERIKERMTKDEGMTKERQKKEKNNK
jgi:hypothetical protein